MKALALILLVGAESIGLSQGSTDDSSIDWHHAATVCGNDFLSVPTTTGNTGDVMSINDVRRKTHVTSDDDVWVGNVLEFYIRNLKTVPRASDLCVSTTFTSISESENDTFTYFYNLNVEPCSNTHAFLCRTGHQQPGLNNISKTWSRANAMCTLWTPDFKLLTTSRDGIIATGQWNSTMNTPAILHTPLWINLVVGVSETIFTPGLHNILQCGYLSSMETDILYTDCYKLKRPGCDHSNETVSERINDRDKGHSTGVYVGVSVAVFVVIIGVVALAVWRMKTRRRGDVDRLKPEFELPKGGRSFIRSRTEPNTATSKEVPDDKRISRYHKIDPKEMKDVLASQIGGLNGYNAHDPGYESIDITKRQNNTPDVVPKVPTRNLPPFPVRGYLTMDGSGKPPGISDENDEYDTIQRSASAKGFTTSGNIYASGSYRNEEVTSDSTYDVTFERKSSKRALIDSYDHVSITSGTMNRGFCESISENSSGVYAIADVVQNPTYDTCP